MEHFDIRKFIMCIGVPNTIDECLKMAKNVEIANQNDEHYSRHVNTIDRRQNPNKQRHSAAQNIEHFQHNCQLFNDRFHPQNDSRLPKR